MSTEFTANGEKFRVKSQFNLFSLKEKRVDFYLWKT